MENASKALIIAGAILLSILIIGLGMTIYQKASGAMEGADMTGTAIDAYNAEFLNYEGVQTGTNARALYKLIQNHNRQNQNDTSKQIKCTVGEGATASATVPPSEAPTLDKLNEIKSGYNYTVTFTYSKAGYIVDCGIAPVK